MTLPSAKSPRSRAEKIALVLLFFLAIIFALSPFFPLIAGDAMKDLLSAMKKTIDLGA
jgi:hypothetical protein